MSRHDAEAIDVVEFVPPELQAHHIGDLGKTTNRRSIGIENMYPCALSKGKYTENEAIAYYENIGWPKPELKKGSDGAKYWYTPVSEESLIALEDLCVDLVMRFPRIYWIGSHFQFCSERIDPDPPIDLALLRKNVTARTGRELADKPKGQPKVTK
jgi:N-acetyl-anhydromuramyl-L-alanine amidase AmpD